MNKQARKEYYIQLWKNSTAVKLSDVYGKYSDRKKSAWAYCERLRDLYSGTELRIVSHNCYTFSAVFAFGNGEYMLITTNRNEVIK